MRILNALKLLLMVRIQLLYHSQILCNFTLIIFIKIEKKSQ